MASILLFVSCEQYDGLELNNKQNFDYSIFNQYKENPAFNRILDRVDKLKFNKSNVSTLEIKNNILEIVNSELNSNLILSDKALELSDYSGEEILDIARNEKWISESDKTLIKSFNRDFQSENFDVAIKNFEKSSLEMNLTKEEFAKKNQFVNVINIFNYQNNEVLTKKMISKGEYVSERGGWGCFFAIVGVALGIVGVTACATVILCGVAIAGYLLAIRTYLIECVAPAVGN